MTTDFVSEIREYARSKYDETGGGESAIFDCVGSREGFAIARRVLNFALDQLPQK